MSGVFGGSGVALKRSNTTGRVELTGGVIEECHKTDRRIAVARGVSVKGISAHGGVVSWCIVFQR